MRYKKLTLCFLLLFSHNNTHPMLEWIKSNTTSIVLGVLFCSGTIIYLVAKVKSSSSPTIANPTKNSSNPIQLLSRDNLLFLYNFIKKDKKKGKEKIFTFPEIATSKKEKALFIACSYGYTQCVKELLEDTSLNVNIIANVPGSTYSYPKAHSLWQASKHNHAEIVQLLLQNPDIIYYQEEGYGEDKHKSALSCACFHNAAEVITILLNHPTKNVPDCYWCEPLIIACKKKHITLINTLLKHENIQKTFSALVEACNTNNEKMIKTLISDNKKLIANDNDYNNENTYTEMLLKAKKYHNILNFLLQPSTIKQLQNMGCKIIFQWETRLREYYSYRYMNSNEKKEETNFLHCIMQCSCIQHIYPSKRSPLALVSEHDIEWTNVLIDAGMNYQEMPDFILHGFVHKVITNLNDLNFFKKLTNNEKNNFIQQQLNYTSAYATHNLIQSGESLTTNPFILDQFITKFLYRSNLNKRNEHGKIPLDVAHEQYKEKHKTKDECTAILAYHSFLRQTPTISPLQLYSILRIHNIIPKHNAFTISYYYTKLTLPKIAEREYVLEFKQNGLTPKHTVNLEGLQKGIANHIKERYRQLDSINPFNG